MGHGNVVVVGAWKVVNRAESHVHAHEYQHGHENEHVHESDHENEDVVRLNGLHQKHDHP